MSLMSLSAAGVRWFSLCLVLLLVCQSLAAAAQVASAPGLRIVVLEGEGAINDIKVGRAHEPVIRVEDENNRPVPGVMVVFTLPDRGASGSFADGSKSLIVHTDSKGQASARGLQPNKTEGPFEIRVDASFQGLTTSSSINQTNVVPITVSVGQTPSVGRTPTKLIAILAIVGGVAAAGALAAKGGSSGASPAPPPASRQTTITPGRPNVGPPQ